MKVFQFILNLIFVFIFSKETAYVYSQFNSGKHVFGKITSIECSSNPKYIKNFTCKLKPLNWEQSVVHVEGDIVGARENVTIRYEYFKYTNQYHPYIINVTVNWCDIMKNRRSNPYFESVYKTLMKYTNLNHTCPYVGHITVKDVYINYELVKYFVPLGKYRLDFSFFDGWPLARICKVTFKVSIEESFNVTRRRVPKFNVKTRTDGILKTND